jgi:hypothetical protein
VSRARADSWPGYPPDGTIIPERPNAVCVRCERAGGLYSVVDRSLPASQPPLRAVCGICKDRPELWVCQRCDRGVDTPHHARWCRREQELPPLLAPTTDGILAAFRGLVVRASTEAELGAVVRRVLDEAGIPYVAEAELGRRSRIDFLVDRTGLELKIDGGASALLRQLDRYAASDKLDALVVITTRRMLARGLPAELRGKPIACLLVGAL